MDLNECYRKGFIKRTEVNQELILSLLEMADSTQKTVESAKLTEENISAYLSLSYDALRETLEAICISLGWKVTSHICIGMLLSTKIATFDFETFDRMHFVRNSINYYGKKVKLEQGSSLVVQMFHLRSECLKLI